jgi:trehalose 6-phosphate synthase
MSNPMPRLVVVSNRVPAIRQKADQAGGLAVGVIGALRATGGLWFGWSGELADGPPRAPNLAAAGGVSYATVDLDRRDFDGFYNSYANRALWPLFHYRINLVRYEPEAYAAYCRVNAQFAERLAPLLRPDDIVWAHDYHLIPLAEELRRLGVRQPVGFFLHTPFPAWQVMLALPNHAEIVRALAAYDLVGFQTPTDLTVFRDYVEREAGGRTDGKGAIEAWGRRFRAGAYAIGIDPAQAAEEAERAVQGRSTRRLMEGLRGRALIVGVDRLDYSKGLPHRFRAYERLLDSQPDLRGRVTFMQIAPPTRERVPEYLELRRELERSAGSINGRYGDVDWTPLRYISRAVPRTTLMGYYRAARVGLVTPLRDGMNLVAKEYVAAQEPYDPGVLVLSRFAGAAHELAEALLVHPFDSDDLAAALGRALAMPIEERRERWRAMFATLQRNDIDAWREAFIGDLTAAARQRQLRARPLSAA